MRRTLIHLAFMVRLDAVNLPANVIEISVGKYVMLQALEVSQQIIKHRESLVNLYGIPEFLELYKKHSPSIQAVMDEFNCSTFEALTKILSLERVQADGMAMLVMIGVASEMQSPKYSQITDKIAEFTSKE